MWRAQTMVRPVAYPPQAALGVVPNHARERREHPSERTVGNLTDARRALLRSQRGPFASTALTAIPSSRATRIDCQPFRILLSRRLHLPLPLFHRTCRCGRQFDVFGHHRAACPKAGVLGKRGFPLERSSASLPKGQALEWLRTFSCATWTSQFLTHSMAAGWRSWRTVSHCGEEPSWPRTRLWCLLSGGTVRPGQGHLITMVLCWRWRDARRKLPTQSSQGKVAALVWWSSPLKLELEQRDGAVPHSIGESTGSGGAFGSARC